MTFSFGSQEASDAVMYRDSINMYLAARRNSILGSDDALSKENETRYLSQSFKDRCHTGKISSHSRTGVIQVRSAVIQGQVSHR